MNWGLLIPFPVIWKIRETQRKGFICTGLKELIVIMCSWLNKNILSTSPVRNYQRKRNNSVVFVNNLLSKKFSHGTSAIWDVPCEKFPTCFPGALASPKSRTYWLVDNKISEKSFHMWVSLQEIKENYTFFSLSFAFVCLQSSSIEDDCFSCVKDFAWSLQLTPADT